MDRNVVLAVILSILIVTGGSDASLIGQFRRIVGIESKEKSPGMEIPPSPSPTSMLNSDPAGKSTEKSPQNPQSPEISPKADPNGKSAQSPQDKSKPGGAPEGTCPVSNRCTDQKKLVACLQHPQTGSQELFLLVQNEGERTLKVKVTVPATVNIPLKELELPKHQVQKINFSIAIGESAEIGLNAGNGDCLLHVGLPKSEGNIFPWLQSYTSRVTPIYGAYILFLTTLIVGGTWACCKWGRKGRRSDGAVPYQELEMGMQESVATVNVDTADGWDQGWDDDWDEEKAVKSAVPHAGNVSANGLTSRSSNREGWENDWDD